MKIEISKQLQKKIQLFCDDKRHWYSRTDDDDDRQVSPYDNAEMIEYAREIIFTVYTLIAEQYESNRINSEV